jgi:hypothetical protein
VQSWETGSFPAAAVGVLAVRGTGGLTTTAGVVVLDAETVGAPTACFGRTGLYSRNGFFLPDNLKLLEIRPLAHILNFSAAEIANGVSQRTRSLKYGMSAIYFP